MNLSPKEKEVLACMKYMERLPVEKYPKYTNVRTIRNLWAKHLISLEYHLHDERGVSYIYETKSEYKPYAEWAIRRIGKLNES